MFLRYTLLLTFNAHITLERRLFDARQQRVYVYETKT